MSDSDDLRQRQEFAADEDQLAASGKRKIRKVESDDDDEEAAYGAPMPSGPKKSSQEEAAGEDDDDGDEVDMQGLENLEKEELERQIEALKQRIKQKGGKNDEGDAAGDGGAVRKREDKAAAKAAAKAQKLAKEEQMKNMHPTLLALEKSTRRRKTEMNDDEKKAEAQQLIDAMTQAVKHDNDCNAKKKPALQKLINLEQISKQIRRIPIQEQFIDMGGCTALGDWLYPLPDGTYPNVKVVSEILQCVDSLHIEPTDLTRSKNLPRMIKIYASGKANMPQVQALAKRIIDKWSRSVFGISTSYYDAVRQTNDEDDLENTTADQNQYRRLRRKLEKIRQQSDSENDSNQGGDSDGDSDAEQKKKKGKQGSAPAALSMASEISRGRQGIIMPARNAFDFVDKPRMQEDMDSSSRGMGGSSGMHMSSKGHEKIKKVMHGIKRQSRSSLVNRRMQTVKSDQ